MHLQIRYINKIALRPFRYSRICKIRR